MNSEAYISQYVRDSVVSIVTVGFPRNRGSGMDKRFTFSPKLSHWLWGPPNLLFNGCRGFIVRG